MFYMMFWVLELPETWSKISAQIVYKKLGFNLFYKKTCFLIHNHEFTHFFTPKMVKIYKKHENYKKNMFFAIIRFYEILTS